MPIWTHQIVEEGKSAHLISKWPTVSSDNSSRGALFKDVLTMGPTKTNEEIARELYKQFSVTDGKEVFGKIIQINDALATVKSIRALNALDSLATLILLTGLPSEETKGEWATKVDSSTISDGTGTKRTFKRDDGSEDSETKKMKLV